MIAAHDRNDKPSSEQPNRGITEIWYCTAIRQFTGPERDSYHNNGNLLVPRPRDLCVLRILSKVYASENGHRCAGSHAGSRIIAMVTFTSTEV
jgi:hypothetical protein